VYKQLIKKIKIGGTAMGYGRIFYWYKDMMDVKILKILKT